MSAYPQLWFYDRVHKIGSSRSFVGKLMAICFIGTHIPLIAFIIFLITETEWQNHSFQIAGVVLLFATLGGTALALFSIYNMLAPIDVARVALLNYREHAQLPRLPTYYNDTAGQLLREVELTINRLHAASQDLAHEARIDPLTGIANRRAIMEQARQIAGDSLMAGRSICCAIIDVDRFKSLNDRYGHGAGDEALIAVAAAMSARVAAPGVVGRLGGDEFCVLIPGGNLEQAGDTLEAVRADVTQAQIGGLPRGAVSLSIGLVECLGGNPTIQTLLQNADTELYRAKEGGRGRISAAACRPKEPQG